MLRLSPPASAVRSTGWPILRLGFRPLYLLAALAGVALMPIWWLVYSGQLRPVSGLAPTAWHAHEMLFGMMSAVIVGFLFTAGKTWTGMPTPRGAHLGFFVLLWIAARASALLAPYPVFFLVDLLFLPLAAATFVHVLVESRNYRNLGVAAILALFALCNLAFHLAVTGALDLEPMRALHAGLALLVTLMTLMGGRVIPAFTRNANPGLTTAVQPWRENLLLLTQLPGMVLWLSGDATLLAAGLLGSAALLQAWRLASWKPAATRGRPILWALHAAYAWIPIGLALLASALVSGQGVSPALHALAVGGGGGLILAMMTRTARGHTGRPLESSGAEVWAYRLVLLAAALRVAVPGLTPSWYGPGLVLAGGMFATAFLLYLIVYSSWLMSPRADGRDD